MIQAKKQKQKIKPFIPLSYKHLAPKDCPAGELTHSMANKEKGIGRNHCNKKKALEYMTKIKSKYERKI